jgi:hypothetical protein
VNRSSGGSSLQPLSPLLWRDAMAPPSSTLRRAPCTVVQAKVDALKRLQAETAAELDALLPSILDRAFKGEP